jgi:hypothetical protein
MEPILVNSSVCVSANGSWRGRECNCVCEAVELQYFRSVVQQDEMKGSLLVNSPVNVSANESWRVWVGGSVTVYTCSS